MANWPLEREHKGRPTSVSKMLLKEARGCWTWMLRTGISQQAIATNEGRSCIKSLQQGEAKLR